MAEGLLSGGEFQSRGVGLSADIIQSFLTFTVLLLEIQTILGPDTYSCIQSAVASLPPTCPLLLHASCSAVKQELEKKRRISSKLLVSSLGFTIALFHPSIRPSSVPAGP